MNFSQLTRYAELSDCERYTVAVHMVKRGGELTCIHHAFRLSDSRAVPATIIGTFGTAEEARERCREHAKNEAAA